MSSCTSKIIGFFLLIYTLFTPSTIINALAEANIKPEKLHTHLEKTNDTSELDIPHVIGSNVQRVSHILSSSPSKLVEQATSYALGKFNSTVSSEAQKWLSQFGTAKINFGLDRKGKLENHSLDLLLPLYDNKTSSLLFSQLGYRNKDSRNTINVGFGGRYFYQGWMYGLNAFHDHDITGKNKRLGLGGEIWGDYIKLAANAYYRLSDWQISRTFEEYHERPANGYDINGEFFLPVYPNLGGKLSYEQYFGENVTLFNRETKQKNPSLVKLGITYTPIPLITIGMDYKQGERNRTETQFLASLNYRMGVPLSAQLSSDNVESMRTLSGSRHDLVERNHHIVLDHRKIPVAEFFVPEGKPQGYKIKDNTLTITTQGHTEKDGNLTADGTSKYIYKAIIVDKHDQNVKKGTIISHVVWNKDKSVDGLTLKASEGSVQIDNDKGELTAELSMTGGKEEKDIIVSLSIEGSPPVVAKKKPAVSFDKANVFLRSLPDTLEINTPYALTVVAKDKDGNAEANKKVTFTSESAEVSFSPSNTTIGANGEANTAMTSKTAGAFKIKVTVEGLATLEPTVTFAAPVEFDISSVEVTNFDKQKPLMGDGKKEYYYRALIVEKSKNKKHIPPQTLKNVQWTHDHGGIDKEKLPPPTPYSPTGGDKFKPDENGYLYAKLNSSVGVENVKVTLTIPRSSSDDTKTFVSKEADKNVDFTPVTQPAVLYAYNTYTNENKYFDNKSGKRHPHNIFWTLRGELRASESSGPFNKDEIIYGIKDVYSPTYGKGMLSIGADKKGPIQFNATGDATITATIKKHTGEIQFYEYKMSTRKLIPPPSEGYHDITDNIVCSYITSSPNDIKPKLFSDKEASDPTNIYSLFNEFGNLYNWGVFSFISGLDKNKPTIVVENTNSAIRQKYRIYDFINNTFDKALNGIILCYLTNIKQPIK
ncbi:MULTISPECIES: inverse autotransporter beta-barrel domain-containing protein [Xenorhabdus]|uniref:inverse autotransporter beta domain-containing protein n=1 Tax=Xenorhabdus TaxID=626 RepID=UPI00068FAFCA|nr:MULTISPECIES: inverse autotransporter beta-barrel domain-containing protein [Xenorhabdus]